MKATIDRVQAFFVKRMSLTEGTSNSDTHSDFDGYQKRRHARVKSILQDFTWLWSNLQTCWGDPA